MASSLRVPRYGLRSFLAILSLSAVFLGFQVNRVHQQQHIVREVLTLDGEVWTVDLASDEILQDWPDWLPVQFDAFVPKSYNYIYLAGDHIGDEELEIDVRLPNLEGLNVSGSRITDAGLRSLHRCKQLKELQLYGISTISESAISELSSRIPACKILR